MLYVKVKDIEDNPDQNVHINLTTLLNMSMLL